VEFGEGAIFDLNAAPDGRLNVLQSNLELVDGAGVCHGSFRDRTLFYSKRRYQAYIRPIVPGDEGLSVRSEGEAVGDVGELVGRGGFGVGEVPNDEVAAVAAGGESLAVTGQGDAVEIVGS